MVEHVDESAWKEREHMAAERVVCTGHPGKEHCNDIFLNELL